MTPSQAAQEKLTSPLTEAGRDFARRIAHFNILGDIGSIVAIEREAVNLYASEIAYDPATMHESFRAEREAAPATPSLDWSRVITAVANTMPDSDTFAAPETVAAEYARLDEGSATPDPDALTDEQIERWLTDNDLFLVTHVHESEDCVECQVGRVSPLPATPDQGKGEPR